MNWTDQDIDNLLQSVTETLEKADILAKSAPLKKDEDGKEEAQEEAAEAAPAQEAPPAEEAPAQEAAPQEEAPAEAAPSAEAAPQEAAPAAEGDQALEQEEDAPLSDEELAQIYTSMPPEELERHYSVIRQALESAYGQDQGQEQQAPAMEAAPAQEAAPAAPEMEKSEKDKEIETLKKQVGEQAAAIEQITKAFEVLTKPSRKSITDIQVMQKSEFDSAPANGGAPMTPEQVKEAARKLNPAKLEKNERELVNKFYLEGVGQKEVEKLIHSKGGK